MLNANIAPLVTKMLAKVEDDLHSSLLSNMSVVNDLVANFMRTGGKRVRPMFHILSSHMCGYFGDDIRNIATILEYVHTSSLLHDDVIDDAKVRRGKPSANATYGNNIAVLTGDYLYTTAFRKILDLQSTNHAYVLTSAVAAMSEAEIFQLQKAGDTDITMQEYMQIIYGKTAALFAAACECGAILGEQSTEFRAHMREYGCHVGYAFQMKDDLLDYFGTQVEIGKKPGTDMGESKVTLPIILLLEELSGAEREDFCQLFLDDDEEDQEVKLAQVLAMLNAHDIETKAAGVIQSHTIAALEHLAPFADSAYKDALVDLAEELSCRKA